VPDDADMTMATIKLSCWHVYAPPTVPVRNLPMSFRDAFRERLTINGPLMLGGGLSWWLVDEKTDPLVGSQRLWGNEWFVLGILPLALLFLIGLGWPRRSRERHAARIAMFLPWMAGTATLFLSWIYVRLVTGHF
jgi:hypothetical protein